MTEIIVVGVDGRETSARAAEKALELARSLGAQLHVVTAFDADRVSSHGTSYERAAVLGDPREKATETTRTVAQGLQADGVTISSFIEAGTPAKALIAHADKHGARMIVVGNRRMKGLARVLGSVANSVAHDAVCDVYIVDTAE
ncbi:universal stress protein [Arthrobacter sp. NPDC090010]|uniref:universal stress protein n=1 Tax=Arthrobacter sp. NPDC090010 TaxID=3363942 RepID=UPI00381CCFCE